MTGFGAIAFWVGIAWAIGVALGGALFPRGRRFWPELVGWGAPLGLAAVAVAEALGLALGTTASPWPWLLLAAGVGGFLLRRRLRGPSNSSGAGRGIPPLAAILALVSVAGALLYVLLALAEPMWANDFLAIWGFKAKVLALAPDGRVPPWLFDGELSGYSHPEYPLGLPLLLAGLARLAGGWDDQALALVYPLLQIATLCTLFGWLRRRGASSTLALAAAALVAFFEPLYSGFLTGMAEVPVSLAILLVGVSLSDALDATDPAAVRRLAAASLMAASAKNEGLFVAVVAGGIALFSGGARRRRLSLAGAAIVPALGPTVAGRLLRGAPPLRDFDFGLIGPARWGELGGRIIRALAEDARLAAGAVPVLAAVAILFVCGRAARWADRPLLIGLVALAAYLTLPALAVRGPEWLADTTLARTAAALAPLAAAGLAGRLAAVFPPAPLVSPPGGSSGS